MKNYIFYGIFVCLSFSFEIGFATNRTPLGAENSGESEEQDNPELHLTLARSYAEQGREKEALEELEKVKGLKPDKSKIFIEMGKIYNLLGYYDTAIELQKEAIKLDSKSTDAYTQLGISYLAKADTPLKDWSIFGREYEIGKTQLKRAIKLDPQNVDAVIRLAIAYTFESSSWEGSGKEAFSLFEKSTNSLKNKKELKKDHALAFVIYGDLCIQHFQIYRAKQIWEEGLNLFPEDKRLKRRLEEISEFSQSKKDYFMRDVTEMIKSEEELIKKNPGDIAHYELTMLRLLQIMHKRNVASDTAVSSIHSPDKLKKLISGYQNVKKPKAWQHFQLGKLYAMNEEHNLSIKELKRAVNLEPKNEKYLIELGKAYLRTCRTEDYDNAPKAIPYLDKAIKINPNNADAYAYLSMAYFYSAFTTPNYTAASVALRKRKIFYDKALELDPHNITALLLKIKINSPMCLFGPCMWECPDIMYSTLETLLDIMNRKQTIGLDDFDIFLDLGYLCMRDGSPYKAEKIWKKGLIFFPSSKLLQEKLNILEKERVLLNE